MATNYWLIKSEPETYSIDLFEKEKTTAWTGVRNYQARNFLKQMNKNDLALFYHSGKERAIVGISKCVKTFYPEPIPGDETTWVQVDFSFIKKLKHPVSLLNLKQKKEFENLLFLKQSRLSVSPVSEKQYFEILKMAEES